MKMRRQRGNLKSPNILEVRKTVKKKQQFAFSLSDVMHSDVISVSKTVFPCFLHLNDLACDMAERIGQVSSTPALYKSDFFENPY